VGFSVWQICPPWRNPIRAAHSQGIPAPGSAGDPVGPAPQGGCASPPTLVLPANPRKSPRIKKQVFRVQFSASRHSHPSAPIRGQKMAPVFVMWARRATLLETAHHRLNLGTPRRGVPTHHSRPSLSFAGKISGFPAPGSADVPVGPAPQRAWASPPTLVLPANAANPRE